MKQAYKWTLKSDYSFYPNFPDFDFGCFREFKDKKGNVWLTVDGNRCTIHKGYSWDGCSPKWRVSGYFNKLIGVWDGFMMTHTMGIIRTVYDYDQQLKYVSLEHDAFTQFTDEMPEHITQKLIDDWFLEGCERVNFILSKPYYWAVRFFQKIVKKRT